MTRDSVRNRILEAGVVPVIRAASADLALAASKAVFEGGIPVLEITLTVPGAMDVIAKLKRAFGDEILVGAGTVLDAESALACLEAGAQFIVSPGFDRPTVRLVNEAGVLMMAGALTPTEVITAWKAGSDFVKIFPCGSVGGPAYIKSLKAALPQIPMIPTGGVTLATALEFLAAGASAVGVGGELISPDPLITEANARQYVTLLKTRSVSSV